VNEEAQRFSGVIEARERGGAYLVLPFRPADVWGQRDRYHVSGTIAGIRVRGPLAQEAGVEVLPVGAAWLRDCLVKPGDKVEVVLKPEGPQLDELDADIAAALNSEPEAQRFFEALAQFYRKAYLAWLAGAKRRPEVRQQRLQDFIELLKAGKKRR
jgi:hypothetical protein